MADPFKTFGSFAAARDSKVVKRSFINWAYRGSIIIILGVQFRKCSIALIKRDYNPVKMELIPQHGVVIIRIERCIAKEGFV